MSRGVSGNALEWALALLRAPAERYALRLRSLPSDVEALLAVAADASPEALAEISRNLAEPEDRVREAARFYAREVLFHPDADAYRILGVAPGASSVQIKAHHRLLQHWLHPDRQQSEGDSVFAARVNGAWNELRNEKRRNAYDEALREAGAASKAHAHPTMDPDPAARRGVAWGWHEENTRPLNRWRHVFPVLALLSVCTLLGWLVIRDGQREPEAWVLEGDVARVANVEEPEGDSKAAPGTGLKSRSNPARSPRSLPAGNRIKSFTNRRDGTVQAKAVAMTSARPESEVHSMPKTKLATESGRLSLPVASSVATPRSTQRPLPVMSPPVRPTVAAAPAKPTARTLVASMASADSIAPQREPPASRPSRRGSPTQSSGGDTAMQSGSQQARAIAGATPVIHSSEPDFARITQARQVGSQLLHYFRKISQPAPPIWNSPAIMSSAGGMRKELHEQGESRLEEPQWRISAASATMSTGFNASGEGPAVRGVLAVDMVWRENRWLVTGLSLEHRQ